MWYELLNLRLRNLGLLDVCTISKRFSSALTSSLKFEWDATGATLPVAFAMSLGSTAFPGLGGTGPGSMTCG